MDYNLVNLKEGESYDSLLLRMIIGRDSLPSIDTYEGKVYFAGNYVLKQFENYEVDIAEVFDMYCKEISGFSDKGYKVPKIYAHKYLTDENGDSYCWLLEERIKGKTLFATKLFRFYNDLLRYGKMGPLGQIDGVPVDFQAFENMRKAEPELYRAIVKIFKRDFLQINTKLADLSEIEIEKFLMTLYNIWSEQEYSFLDCHGGNVVFDGKNLTYIDNEFLYNTIGEKTIQVEEDRTPGGSMITNAIALFEANMSANGNMSYNGRTYDKHASELINRNKKATAAAIEKFIKIAKSLCDTTIRNRGDYGDTIEILANVLPKDERARIIDMIEFEK